MNVSSLYRIPRGHRGPSGKAMICEVTDHSFFHWGRVHERQLQSVTHPPPTYSFRWHRRDPAKVRRHGSVAAAPHRRGLMNRSVASRARSEWAPVRRVSRRGGEERA
ncbi:hypothetical protein OIU84_029068 [Salix udensis]|uniref:Uncharacterized protein n=1 Tax=Salix udensis TaxID=889485 RepID=A0AAD6PAW0_9ROSI|nr:hypothetical protein OIU84_029068 [Salix udensis]